MVSMVKFKSSNQEYDSLVRTPTGSRQRQKPQRGMLRQASLECLDCGYQWEASAGSKTNDINHVVGAMLTECPACHTQGKISYD